MPLDERIALFATDDSLVFGLTTEIQSHKAIRNNFR